MPLTLLKIPKINFVNGMIEWYLRWNNNTCIDPKSVELYGI